MSETGFFIFLAAIIGVAVLGAVIAVIAAVSGASAAIADEEDSAEDVKTSGEFARSRFAGCFFIKKV